MTRVLLHVPAQVDPGWVPGQGLEDPAGPTSLIEARVAQLHPDGSADLAVNVRGHARVYPRVPEGDLVGQWRPRGVLQGGERRALLATLQALADPAQPATLQRLARVALPGFRRAEVASLLTIAGDPAFPAAQRFDALLAALVGLALEASLDEGPT